MGEAPKDWKIASQKLTGFYSFQAEHVGEISGPVKVWIWLDEFVVKVFVTEDESGKDWDLCNDIHGIFIRQLPIHVAVEPLRISSCEMTFGL